MTTHHTHSDLISYETLGSGDPVVLIHGYPLDRRSLSEVAAILAEHHRVINVDLRGFGASPWPPDGDLSMDRHAEDVVAVLDAEDVDRAAIVGLSMGGYVALALADHHPDRVVGLGLIGAKTQPDAPEAKLGRDGQAAQILEHGRTSVVEGLTGALFPHGGEAVQRARLRTMIEATPYETYVSALVGMRDRPDRGHVVRDLDVRVAVVAGEHDRLVPRDLAVETAASAKHGAATIVPDAGHLVSMEQPAAVAEALASLFGD
jgi:pimeloyl-ACP methyl ester carboxylesterase